MENSRLLMFSLHICLVEATLRLRLFIALWQDTLKATKRQAFLRRSCHQFSICNWTIPRSEYSSFIYDKSISIEDNHNSCTISCLPSVLLLWQRVQKQIHFYLSEKSNWLRCVQRNLSELSSRWTHALWYRPSVQQILNILQRCDGGRIVPTFHETHFMTHLFLIQSWLNDFKLTSQLTLHSTCWSLQNASRRLMRTAKS
jgi:hypothetical protein